MSGHSAPSVHQTSNKLLREALHEVLRAAVQAGPGAANGIGSVPCRAVAALYLVLLNHPIDRRGRCRSCRRPGAVFGRRRRRCRVHGAAHLYLRESGEFLLSHLARELGMTTPQTPAVSPPLPPRGFPRAGRPAPDHGGAGERPERPRSRRDPPDDQLGAGSSLVVVGGAAWQT